MGAAIGFLVFGWTGSGHASHIFDECQITCEVDCDDGGSGPNCVEAEGGECILGTDITCNDTSVAVVTLRDGMNLDVHGNTITCQSGVNCGDAVLIAGSGSKVYNSDDAEALITGHFADGVDCALNATSEVTGIHIHNTLVGVRDCKLVQNNVITGMGRLYLTANWGVYTNGVTAGGDLIRENYISDKHRGVSVAGTDAVEVSNNVIHTTTWTPCAVELQAGNAEAIVESNTALGVGNVAFGSTRKIICQTATPPPDAVIQSNLCDKDHPDCATCQANGDCTPFVAPFPQ